MMSARKPAMTTVELVQVKTTAVTGSQMLSLRGARRRDEAISATRAGASEAGLLRFARNDSF
jgi:hypothetical protein